MDDDNDEAAFRDYYLAFRSYPKDLIRNKDRPKLIEACARYHACHVRKMFPGPNSGAYIEIRDYGLDHQGREARDLVRDPKARFVIIESPHWLSEELNITQNMLFKILAYHQVSPHYLRLITSFSYQARASDPNVGSINCKEFFKEPGLRVQKMGRSGHHFQLAFQLTSYLGDHVKGDGKVTWARYRAAVYHHFDIVQARSLWIITAPLRPDTAGWSGDKKPTKHYLWTKVKESVDQQFSDATQPRSWLKSSFEVFLSLGDWSLEEWGFYLHHLGEEIMNISGQYLDGEDHMVAGKDLQMVNLFLFKLAECKLRLEGNSRVLKYIRDFYKSQLLEKTKHLGDGVEWLTKCKKDIDDFADQLDVLIQSTDDVWEKANQIHRQGKDREEYMQKLLQNQMNKVMKAFSELNHQKASVMGILQIITVLFLPVTVVSTVFSTDIVKFQGLSEGEKSRFSPTALWIWCLTTALLTGATLLSWRYLVGRGHHSREQLVVDRDIDSDGQITSKNG